MMQMNRRGFLKAMVATAAITTGLARTRIEQVFSRFNENYPIGHVLRHWADPTGQMNSSHAIQAAIDEGIKHGVDVVFGGGNFMVEETLKVNENVTITGGSLDGAGKANPVLYYAPHIDGAVLEGMHIKNAITGIYVDA